MSDRRVNTRSASTVMENSKQPKNSKKQNVTKKRKANEKKDDNANVIIHIKKSQDKQSGDGTPKSEPVDSDSGNTIGTHTSRMRNKKPPPIDETGTTRDVRAESGLKIDRENKTKPIKFFKSKSKTSQNEELSVAKPEISHSVYDDIDNDEHMDKPLKSRVGKGKLNSSYKCPKITDSGDKKACTKSNIPLKQNKIKPKFLEKAGFSDDKNSDSALEQVLKPKTYIVPRTLQTEGAKHNIHTTSNVANKIKKRCLTKDIIPEKKEDNTLYNIKNKKQKDDSKKNQKSTGSKGMNQLKSKNNLPASKIKLKKCDTKCRINSENTTNPSIGVKTNLKSALKEPVATQKLIESTRHQIVNIKTHYSSDEEETCVPINIIPGKRKRGFKRETGIQNEPKTKKINSTKDSSTSKDETASDITKPRRGAREASKNAMAFMRLQYENEIRSFEPRNRTSGMRALNIPKSEPLDYPLESIDVVKIKEEENDTETDGQLEELKNGSEDAPKKTRLGKGKISNKKDIKKATKVNEIAVKQEVFDDVQHKSESKRNNNGRLGKKRTECKGSQKIQPEFRGSNKTSSNARRESLRNAPGSGSVGRFWDVGTSDDESISSDSSVSNSEDKKHKSTVSSKVCVEKDPDSSLGTQIDNDKEIPVITLKKEKNDNESDKPSVMDIDNPPSITTPVESQIGDKDNVSPSDGRTNVEERPLHSFKKIHRDKAPFDSKRKKQSMIVTERSSSVSDIDADDESDSHSEYSQQYILQRRRESRLTRRKTVFRPMDSGSSSTNDITNDKSDESEVRITDVYSSRTSRSTHSERICSISDTNHQYRFSHVETEATAVTREMILHRRADTHELVDVAKELSPSRRSYTPLGALSNMNPPDTSQKDRIGDRRQSSILSGKQISPAPEHRSFHSAFSSPVLYSSSPSQTPPVSRPLIISPPEQSFAAPLLLRPPQEPAIIPGYYPQGNPIMHHRIPCLRPDNCSITATSTGPSTSSSNIIITAGTSRSSESSFSKVGPRRRSPSSRNDQHTQQLLTPPISIVTNTTSECSDNEPPINAESGSEPNVDDRHIPHPYTYQPPRDTTSRSPQFDFQSTTAYPSPPSTAGINTRDVLYTPGPVQMMYPSLHPTRFLPIAPAAACVRSLPTTDPYQQLMVLPTSRSEPCTTEVPQSIYVPVAYNAAAQSPHHSLVAVLHPGRECIDDGHRLVHVCQCSKNGIAGPLAGIITTSSGPGESNTVRRQRACFNNDENGDAANNSNNYNQMSMERLSAYRMEKYFESQRDQNTDVYHNEDNSMLSRVISVPELGEIDGTQSFDDSNTRWERNSDDNSTPSTVIDGVLEQIQIDDNESSVETDNIWERSSNDNSMPSTVIGGVPEQIQIDDTESFVENDIIWDRNSEDNCISTMIGGVPEQIQIDDTESCVETNIIWGRNSEDNSIPTMIGGVPEQKQIDDTESSIESDIMWDGNSEDNSTPTIIGGVPEQMQIDNMESSVETDIIWDRNEIISSDSEIENFSDASRSNFEEPCLLDLSFNRIPTPTLVSIQTIDSGTEVHHNRLVESPCNTFYSDNESISHNFRDLPVTSDESSLESDIEVIERPPSEEPVYGMYDYFRENMGVPFYIPENNIFANQFYTSIYSNGGVNLVQESFFMDETENIGKVCKLTVNTHMRPVFEETHQSQFSSIIRLITELRSTDRNEPVLSDRQYSPTADSNIRGICNNYGADSGLDIHNTENTILQNNEYTFDNNNNVSKNSPANYSNGSNHFRTVQNPFGINSTVANAPDLSITNNSIMEDMHTDGNHHNEEVIDLSFNSSRGGVQMQSNHILPRKEGLDVNNKPYKRNADLTTEVKINSSPLHMEMTRSDNNLKKKRLVKNVKKKAIGNVVPATADNSVINRKSNFMKINKLVNTAPSGSEIIINETHSSSKTVEEKKPGIENSDGIEEINSKSRQRKTSKHSLKGEENSSTTASQKLKYSNGWQWVGRPYMASIFVNGDGTNEVRKCYRKMIHVTGEIISRYDCVLLRSGTRQSELPYIGKVAHLWENPTDNEMMVSLMWYYRPEHVANNWRYAHDEHELYASRHKDVNSVACIEDKCYVLTFNEYNRYRKELKQKEEDIFMPRLMIPEMDDYLATSSERPQKERKPAYTHRYISVPDGTSLDSVFFCRKFYDIRQKRILKNPCFD